MAFSLKTNFFVPGSNETSIKARTKGCLELCSSIGSLQFPESKVKGFMGKSLPMSDLKGLSSLNVKAPPCVSVQAQASICVSHFMRWWEKTLKPNMIEIHSAQELVDSLLLTGDKLVIVDFYSSGCGGCKALHPKICQLAESNPEEIFLKVNYEELKTMCYSLHIHVLPFFRFYRGAEGRLCSFSCTNATIKKFKDALAKHGADRCSLGPAKGLDESELLSLASAGQISINLRINPTREEDEMEDLVLEGIDISDALGTAGDKMGFKEESAVLMA